MFVELYNVFSEVVDLYFGLSVLFLWIRNISFWIRIVSGFDL